jgi:hypothetical protein
MFISQTVKGLDFTQGALVEFSVAFKDDVDPSQTVTTTTKAMDMSSHAGHTSSVATRILHYTYEGTAEEAIKMLNRMAFDFVGFYKTWRDAWNGVAGVNDLPALDTGNIASWLPAVRNNLLTVEDSIKSFTQTNPPPAGRSYKPCIVVLISTYPDGDPKAGQVMSLGLAPVFHLV